MMEYKISGRHVMTAKISSPIAWRYKNFISFSSTIFGSVSVGLVVNLTSAMYFLWWFMGEWSGDAFVRFVHLWLSRIFEICVLHDSFTKRWLWVTYMSLNMFRMPRNFSGYCRPAWIFANISLVLVSNGNAIAKSSTWHRRKMGVFLTVLWYRQGLCVAH